MQHSSEPIRLDGRPLDFAALAAIAAGGRPVTADPVAMERVRASHAALQAALDGGAPVYGANTGVGALRNRTTAAADMPAFGANLLMAHHFGVGEPLSPEVVRMAVGIRANTALAGATGCGAGLVDGLLALLTAGITPVVRGMGSMGCADIGLMGQIGAVLAGEGEAFHAGHRRPAAEALAATGLRPLDFGPRDGLAALSSNAIGVAATVEGVGEAARVIRRLMITGLASAAAMGATRSSWTAAAAIGTPQQARVGRWLGEAAAASDAAVFDRLHDPLSIRMMPQIFAAALDAAEAAGRAVLTETGRVDDNPVVVGGAVLSSGGSLPLDLVLAVEALALALAHLARNAMNRCILIANGRMRGLPVNLVAGDRPMTGFGPALKLAAELFQRVLSLSFPVSAQPIVVADGLEDEATFLPLAVERVGRQVEALRLLAALEALMAVEAMDIAGDRPTALLGRLHGEVRAVAPRRDHDRPLSDEIEVLAARLFMDAEEPRLTDLAPFEPFDAFFSPRRPFRRRPVPDLPIWRGRGARDGSAVVRPDA